MMTTSNSESGGKPELSRGPVPEANSSLNKQAGSAGVKWAQALVLVALFVFTAVLCLRNAGTGDPDIWWHLRTAEWILQHHAVPYQEPFSVYGVGKPWAAYSWLYELIVFKLYQWWGLAGIAIYTTAMVLCIVALLHRLIRRVGGDFSVGVLLVALAAMSMTRVYMPRSWLFTILFFVIELDLLVQARMTGKVKGLILLPLIFALWANLHIQFVGGLIVLAVALADALLARRFAIVESRIPAGRLGGIFVMSVMATLINPYGWRLYQVIHEYASEVGELTKVNEAVALPFRRLDDWFVLFLLLAAAAALGRTRRVDFFESALLALAAFASFRSQRDLWVVVIVATLILAERIRGDERNKFLLTASSAPAVALATVLAVFLCFRIMHVNNDRLGADLALSSPVRAVEAIEQNGWKGPLFNDYTWGGYLIWTLRMPVSTDSRQNVYGDVVLDRSYATWNAQPNWNRDPDLMKANLVVGPINAPLMQLLQLDPQFKLVYKDKVAAVFIAAKGGSLGAGQPGSAGNGQESRAVK
jgi:hypothetical protein